MSEESLEQLARRFFDAWNRQDLDACLAMADPEIEYVNAPSALEPGTRSGHHGLSVVLRKQWEGLGPTARAEVDRVDAQGDEGAVVGRLSREMPGSSSRIEVRGVFRMTLRGGRIARLEQLGAGTSFDAALRAAGLSE
jgi:ketosteroid isomerase-like protein